MHTLSALPPLPAMATPILPCSPQGLKAGGEDGPSGTAERISPAEGHRAGIVRERHGGIGGSRGPMDMDVNMEGWSGAWSLELCGGSYSGQGPNKPCLHFLVPLSECLSSQGRDIALVLVVLWRPPPYYVDFYQPSLKGLAMCPDLIQTRSSPLFPSFYHWNQMEIHVLLRLPKKETAQPWLYFIPAFWTILFPECSILQLGQSCNIKPLSHGMT